MIKYRFALEIGIIGIENYFLIMAKFFVRFLQLGKELQNLKRNIFRLGYKKNDFGKYKFYVKNTSIFF